MRQRISFRPSWKGPIERWAISYIRKNFWRLENYYEFGDIYNDAYLKFEKCRLKYPEVTEAPHFMRLFQRSLINHIHSLSTNRSTYITASSLEKEDSEKPNSVLDILSENSLGEFNVKMSKAPQELQSLIQMIHNNDEAFKKLKKMQKELKNIKNEVELNYKLCRIINADYKSTNLIGQLTEFLDFNGKTFCLRK